MNLFRNSWHKFASIGFTKWVKGIVLILGKKLKPLNQKFIQIVFNFFLSSWKFVGITESSSYWIINVNNIGLFCPCIGIHCSMNIAILIKGGLKGSVNFKHSK